MNGVKILKDMIDTPFTPLTYDEFHSFVMGGIGFFFGHSDNPIIPGLISLFVIFADSSDRKGLRAILKEPWYFIGSLTISYGIGRYV